MFLDKSIFEPLYFLKLCSIYWSVHLRLEFEIWNNMVCQWNNRSKVRRTPETTILKYLVLSVPRKCSGLFLIRWPNYSRSQIPDSRWRCNLNHYFDRHVCPSIRPSFRHSVIPSVRHKIFFSLKSPWNHPLTPGVHPWGWPRVPPGHAAPPEELARARRALSSANKK